MIVEDEYLTQARLKFVVYDGLLYEHYRVVSPSRPMPVYDAAGSQCQEGMNFRKCLGYPE